MDVFASRGKTNHRTLLTPAVGDVLLPSADPLPRLVIGVMVMRTLVGRLRTRQVAVLSPYPLTYKLFSKPAFQPWFNGKGAFSSTLACCPADQPSSWMILGYICSDNPLFYV
ncbi:hypothetical protein PCANC_16445 [Puccinia coronata f. sp. avenae]|uniref:Uncharacterized protein n=1 Tax=Puccinia coronata f. sp. avenae TaxID=200324 RepID=A0A2N5SZG2_9BASI|nr:hypothetical protein PCANC_09215 [Puccinia coronata f. sp. avenae]PLW33492.1 hypothetical protein PCANC_16445 [Puccinia coronata f. sp. avenae]